MEAQNAVVATSSFNRLNHADWCGCRSIILRDNANYANRAVNVSPAFVIDVEVNKEIARKKGPTDLFNLTRMADYLFALREKDRKVLVLQMSGCSALAVRLAINRIPARKPPIFGRQPPLLCNATSAPPLDWARLVHGLAKSASSGNASALGKPAHASPMLAYPFRNYWHKPMIPKEDSRWPRITTGTLTTK